MLRCFTEIKKDLKNNINLIDECPLGSAALAGTSYNIDRNYTAKKLGLKNQLAIQLTPVSDRDLL